MMKRNDPHDITVAYYLADASTILLLSDEFWSALRHTGLPGEEHCYRDTTAFGRYIDDHAATEAAALLVIILESETSGRSSADRISNMLSRAGANVNPAAQLSIVRCQLRAEDSAQAHVLAVLREVSEPEHHRRCPPIDVAFDPAWSFIPPHRRQVFLCNGPRCAHRGAARLWKMLAQQLAQRGLLESERGVLLTRTHCQYPCNLGPVLTVYPDGCWYGVSSPEDICRLVDEHFQQDKPVADLLLTNQTDEWSEDEN